MDAEPGDRIDGEGQKAFEAFRAYRDLGPTRSLAQVAQGLGKSRTIVARWSAEFAWVERVAAWDDYADRLDRERDLAERREARRRMLEDHARAGRALVQVGAQALANYDASDPERAADARRRIDCMTAAEAARLMEAGSKMERLARGETSERVDMREAMKWVDGFLEVALTYVPVDAQDAFLADVDAQLGTGAA
jgi:hypothetical protein